jgi:hypothetical protein
VSHGASGARTASGHPADRRHSEPSKITVRDACVASRRDGAPSAAFDVILLGFTLEFLSREGGPRMNEFGGRATPQRHRSGGRER